MDLGVFLLLVSSSAGEGIIVVIIRERETNKERE